MTGTKVTEAHREEAQRFYEKWRLPGSVEALAQALADAERRGMERAAGIAETFSGLFDIPSPDSGPFTKQDATVEQCKTLIAKAIRSQP